MQKSIKSLVSGVKFGAIITKAWIKNPNDRKAAAQYIAGNIGKIPGIPAKIAQILSSKCEISPQDLSLEMTPLPIEEVKSLILERSPNCAESIEWIDSRGICASLGQVHKAVLKDGAEVAIKVQYPGVKEEMERHLGMLFKAATLGPQKKYGLDIAGYESYIKQSLLDELDYYRTHNRQYQQTDYQQNCRKTTSDPTFL